jgi:hypothetical protein
VHSSCVHFGPVKHPCLLLLLLHAVLTLAALLRVPAFPPADAERVSLLCGIGALNQKPRAQLLGVFLADMQPRLAGLSRGKLCDCLQALAQLRLTKVDTQVRVRHTFFVQRMVWGTMRSCAITGAAAGGWFCSVHACWLLFVARCAAWRFKADQGPAVLLSQNTSTAMTDKGTTHHQNLWHHLLIATQGVRVTTAQSIPTPSEFISALLAHLNPQLAGADGASASELAAVLAALAALGYSPDEAWLAQALQGAAGETCGLGLV